MKLNIAITSLLLTLSPFTFADEAAPIEFVDGSDLPTVGAHTPKVEAASDDEPSEQPGFSYLYVTNNTENPITLSTQTKNPSYLRFVYTPHKAEGKIEAHQPMVFIDNGLFGYPNAEITLSSDLFDEPLTLKFDGSKEISEDFYEQNISVVIKASAINYHHSIEPAWVMDIRYIDDADSFDKEEFERLYGPIGEPFADDADTSLDSNDAEKESIYYFPDAFPEA